MKVTRELTEEEAREYLRYKQFKGREAEEIADLDKRLQQLATFIYEGVAIDETSGEAVIANRNYVFGALHFAEKELFEEGDE